MKKIRNILIAAMVLILGAGSVLFPLQTSATDYGDGDHRLSMELFVSPDVEIRTATVNGNYWDNMNDIFKTDGDNGIYTIVISAKSFDEEQYAVRLNSQNIAIPDPTVDDDNVYTFTLNLNSQDLDWNHPENSDNYTCFISFGIDTYRPDTGDDPQYPPAWDDGAVYFVWADGDGEENNFYYHKITNVVGGGVVNRVPVSTVTHDLDNNVKYNIKNRTRTAHSENGDVREEQSYEFVWAPRDISANQNCFEVIKDTNSFIHLTTTAKFEYLRNNDMTVNPVGAQCGENCISTMGDLAFKLTIYNDAPDTYEGIQVGVPENYSYYPSYWDRVFHWDIVDVSGTTSGKPEEYEVFLLENTLQLRCAENITSRNIVSVEPLNVPNKAVTIERSAEDENVWNITYGSRYYDNVKLKITDTAGKVYYLTLVRSNVVLRGLMTDPDGIYAAVYYPQDDSYRDYQVVLKINHDDGTSETKVLSAPVKGIETESGDIEDAYEISGGENLKTAWYKLDGITRSGSSDVSSFFITVVKGCDPNSDYSNGILAGSGYGIEFRNTDEGFRRVTNAEGSGRTGTAPEAAKGTASDITSLDVAPGDKQLTVSGTTEESVKAVSLFIYNKSDLSLAALKTSSVSDDNKFSETIALDYGDYIVRAADYDGGQAVTNDSVSVSAPVKITPPKGKTLTYNGKTQTGVDAGEGYTLSGRVSAKEAGSYSATATLKSGYIWSDGTTGPKTISWKIKKANPSLSLVTDGIKDTTGYKESQTFKADAKNLPDNSEIHWFVNGEDAGTGKSFTVKDPTEDYTVRAKVVDKDGNVLKETETLKVHVKNGFFDKLLWFIRELIANIMKLFGN